MNSPRLVVRVDHTVVLYKLNRCLLSMLQFFLLLLFFLYIRMFAIGVGTTSLLTLFTPPLAHTSTALLITVRVIEGLFEVRIIYFVY